MRKTRAFTLVELLVVIGIIALLVGILLPALSAARRQANALKCATSLREIGSAFQMYAMENRGYWPVAKTDSVYRLTTPTRPPTDLTQNQYWQSFLAKYVARVKQGLGTSTADQALAQKSVLWGCPSWDPYTAGSVQVQSGYGMNAFPEFTANFPTPGGPPNDLPKDTALGADNQPLSRIALPRALNDVDWGAIISGKWYKQKAWTKPAERALIADARFWLLEVQAAPMNKVLPGQSIVQYQVTYADSANDGQTLYDFYRHGKYPNIASGSGNNARYEANGGKVAFNVLFCDGHVATLNLREDGYRAARMRFPG